jgi:hypothetical protein
MIYCIIISSFYILLQGVGVTVGVGVDPNFFSVINKQTNKTKQKKILGQTAKFFGYAKIYDYSFIYAATIMHAYPFINQISPILNRIII